MTQVPSYDSAFITDGDKEQFIESLNVPEELKTVPGNPTRPADERYHAYAYPEQPFFRTPNYELYDAYMGRQHRDITTAKSHSQVATEMHGEELEELRKTVWSYHLKPASKKKDPSEDLAGALKAKAKEMGFAVVGITKFERKYVFKDFKRRAKFKNLVIVGIEQPWEPVQTSPSIESYMSNFKGDHPLLQPGGSGLADWVRSTGYRVQFVVASQGGIQLSLAPVLPPYAVAAGLGTDGGQRPAPDAHVREPHPPVRLLPPTRPSATTNPWTTASTSCARSARSACGAARARALPKVKVWWRGALKYKTIADRCLPMLGPVRRLQHLHKGLPGTEVRSEGGPGPLQTKRARSLGKGTDELEAYTLPNKGYFPSGQMPVFSTEEGSRGMIAMGNKLKLRPVRRKATGPHAGHRLRGQPDQGGHLGTLCISGEVALSDPSFPPTPSLPPTRSLPRKR